MGNFKIKVNSEAESKEAQDLLVKMGYHARANWTERNPIHESIQAWSDGEFTFSLNHHQVPVGFKEITLPELRAMVSPMKEYLDKQEDGTYKLITASSGCADRDWIEIPEGATSAAAYDSSEIEFYKEESKEFFNNYDLVWQSYNLDVRGTIVWQREQDEPLLTPECKLNDQYAEIEQVRQHRHYFIDVSDVDEIDFYEIALRYNVTDPCIQHILKKCLAVGQRGQKDFHHDLKDIYDTAKRMLDVHGLDS